MTSGRPVFEIAYHPTRFEVGTHTLLLAKAPGGDRWTLTLDGTLVPGTFQTEVEAWEAGVRGADQLDRKAAGRS
jgi:hypothetical protein